MSFGFQVIRIGGEIRVDIVVKLVEEFYFFGIDVVVLVSVSDYGFVFVVVRWVMVYDRLFFFINFLNIF